MSTIACNVPLNAQRGDEQILGHSLQIQSLLDGIMFWSTRSQVAISVDLRNSKQAGSASLLQCSDVRL